MQKDRGRLEPARGPTFQIDNGGRLFSAAREGFEKIPGDRKTSRSLRSETTGTGDARENVGMNRGSGAEKCLRVTKNRRRMFPCWARRRGAFRRRIGIIQDGTALTESGRGKRRDVCVLGTVWQKRCSLLGRHWANGSNSTAINYTVIGGVLEAKGTMLGGTGQVRRSFHPPPLNRYVGGGQPLHSGPGARPASYDDTVEQVRGAFRTIRKGRRTSRTIRGVLHDSMITQFKSFLFAVRMGVVVVSSIALIAAASAS